MDHENESTATDFKLRDAHCALERCAFSLEVLLDLVVAARKAKK